MRVFRPYYTHATSLGYRCLRRIVYMRTMPDKAEQISEELSSIFAEGNLHQVDVRHELAKIGYEVVEAESNFRDDALEISGSIDGKIMLSDYKGAPRIPIEIKSSAGNPPQSDHELSMHRGLYGRYWCQMQVYLYLTSSPLGLMIYKDKITGLWSVVVVELDYEQTEHLLRKAEIVRDHVAAGTLPDRLDDRSECGGCPWRDTECHPAEHAPDPMLLAIDDKLEAQLRERESLDESRRRYQDLDKTIKERFKMTHGTRFVCGDYVLEKKKHGRGTRLDIKRSGS